MNQIQRDKYKKTGIKIIQSIAPEKMDVEKTLLEIKAKLKTLLNNDKYSKEKLNGGNGKMENKAKPAKKAPTKAAKKAKRKGRTYSNDIRKRAVELFVNKRAPKQIVEDLEKEFEGKTPKLKAVKRYIRAAGHTINGR